MRFIINFIVPVYKATRQMKQQVRDFNEKMGQAPTGATSTPKNEAPSSPKPKAGDYIDFEEIRN